MVTPRRAVMPSDDTHTIRNGIIATVVGGVILAAILSLLGWLPKLLRWLAALALGVLRHFAGSVQIPIWLLYVLAGGCLVLVVRVILSLLSSGGPTWRDYTQDTFPVLGDMVWRWDYVHGKPFDVWCYCPNDDTKLVYSTRQGNRYSLHRNELITRVTCETCGKTYPPVLGDVPYIVNAARRQIDRKLRTGEWKEVMAAQEQGEKPPNAEEQS